MNKIKLALTPPHLRVVVSDFYDTITPPLTTRVGKVVNSISSELMIKLEKKLITKRGETKEFSASLKYHEAFALLEIAQKQSVYADNEYERNVYRLLVKQLDQQL